MLSTALPCTKELGIAGSGRNEERPKGADAGQLGMAKNPPALVAGIGRCGCYVDGGRGGSNAEDVERFIPGGGSRDGRGGGG